MSFPILKDKKKPRHVRNTGTREDMELKKRIKGCTQSVSPESDVQV